MPLRILVWNLLHGGGRRIPDLAAAIVAHAADVCVLAESRPGPAQALRGMLAGDGYPCHASTPVQARQNGVLVLSRLELEVRPRPAGAIYDQRWLTLGLGGFELVAWHVPPKVSIGVGQKRAFWLTLLEYAEAHLDQPAMIAGDLNTGAPHRDEHGASLYCAEEFIRLAEMGWVDAWRRFHGPTRKEWSWASQRRPTYGFRLDHVFCSPPLAGSLVASRYSHEERLARISDHSILLVDLALQPSPVR